ncbi:MAG: hypothetical protein GWN58_20940, partial [Anaerolineae bacterium]|nr:hypothetical protein [Anaerolineae bacterium]
GELGFYLVSDGGTNPYRYHVRSSCSATWARWRRCRWGTCWPMPSSSLAPSTPRWGR